jgi:hypothetical protein
MERLLRSRTTLLLLFLEKEEYGKHNEAIEESGKHFVASQSHYFGSFFKKNNTAC